MTFMKTLLAASGLTIVLAASTQIATASDIPSCASPYRMHLYTSSRFRCLFRASARVPSHVWRAGSRSVRNYMVRRYASQILAAARGCRPFRVTGSGVHVAGRHVAVLRAHYDCER